MELQVVREFVRKVSIRLHALTGTGFATSVSAFNPPGATVTAASGSGSSAGFTNVVSLGSMLAAAVLAVIVA